MAHDHGASGPSHDHAAGATEKMLRWALALTSADLVTEVVGGFVVESLALLSAAAHMLTDVAAPVIALMALRIGAAFRTILVSGIAIYVFLEAVLRPGLQRHES